MNSQQLTSLLAAHGAPEIVVPSDDSNYVFAIFPTPELAAAAHAALDGHACPGAGTAGRKLVARFSEAIDVAKELDPGPAPGTPPRPVAFTAEQVGITGLYLLRDFVTPQQEQQLLAAVDGSTAWVDLAKRRVLHFGWEFDYTERSFGSKLGPLPPFVDPLLPRIHELPCMGGQVLDQLTVNEYSPGVGISPHVDTHSAFTGAIVSLSLGSPCVMELRRGSDHRPLLLPPRSLLVLSGEARYAWHHYIPHRKVDVLAPAGGAGGGSAASTDGSVGSQQQLQPASCSGAPPQEPASPPAGPSSSEPSDHAISPDQSPWGPAITRARRVSFTFRTIRGFACNCCFPEQCDSQSSSLPATRLAALKQHQEQGQGQEQQEGAAQTQAQAPQQEAVAASNGGSSSGDADSSAAAGGDSGSACASKSGEAALQQLEDEHVNAVYDAIASHFSATRFAIWPRVRQFITDIPHGAVVADVGCGNGKYFGVRRDLAVLGSDRSAGLAEVASKRLHPAGIPASEVPKADVLQADALSLPFRTGSCDAVLCIAVLHHISSVPRRVRLLQQLMGALRPGGRALVTVWASEQEDPDKTLKKWQRIAAPDQQQLPSGSGEPDSQAAADSSPAASALAAGAEAEAAELASAPGAAAGGSGSSTGAAAIAAAPDGGDYLVPWHLPFHRAGNVQARAQVGQAAPAAADASAVAQGAAERQQSQAAGSSGTGGSSSGAAPGAGRAGATAKTHTSIDHAKGTVVYKRYYHLFEKGELESLVAQLEGARLVEVFYDRSNWCVIIERM